MLVLAVVILVLAGLYVCVKREVRASSSMLIRGRPAEHIGLVLFFGGIASGAVPWFCALLGVFRNSESNLMLSVLLLFVSILYVAVIVAIESRKRPPRLPYRK